MEAMSEAHTTLFYSKGNHTAELHACRWPYLYLYLPLSLFLRPIVIYLSIPGLSISLVWKRRQVCSVHWRWRSRIYITDLKNQTYKGIHLFLFYIRVYNIIYNVTCMYRFHIDWQHGRFSCVGSVSIFSQSLGIFVQYVMCVWDKIS